MPRLPIYRSRRRQLSQTTAGPGSTSVAAGRGRQLDVRCRSKARFFATTGFFTPANLFAVETAVGGIAFANAGWAFGNGLETEVNYRSNNADSVRTTYAFSTTNDSRTGRISSESVMANVLYDIGSTKGWPVYLTVGGGVGYASVKYDNVGVRALDGVGGYQTVKLNDTAGGFAWQSIIGATVPLRTVPGLELSAVSSFLNDRT